MRERWIVALCVLQFAILLGGALFVGLSAYQAIQQIPRIPFPINSTQTYPYPHITPWPPIESNYTTRSIPVIHNDTQHYVGTYKPYITTANLTAMDYHINKSIGMGSLRISGFLNNTGDGAAYNLFLQVVAMNKEGKAIDTLYDATGLTPHMGMAMTTRQLNYNGTALTNCTITPIYFDKVDALKQIPSVNASALP